MHDTNTSTDVVSVPFYVEKDGAKTLFLPALRRKKGYTIGEKGKEEHILDYWEALARLKQMDVVRFRRPSPKTKVPGIVICKPGNWQDVAIADIEAARIQVGG